MLFRSNNYVLTFIEKLSYDWLRYSEFIEKSYSNISKLRYNLFSKIFTGYLGEIKVGICS